MNRRGIEFWLLQVPGWLLFVYLVYAQAVSAFSYELGVSMGTQEPAALITGVGVAFFYGFAFADLVFYIPLLGIGLAGYALDRRWGETVLGAALAITVYWPIVSLTALVTAREAQGWNLVNEVPFWVVLPLITLWAAWGLWRIVDQARSG